MTLGPTVIAYDPDPRRTRAASDLGADVASSDDDLFHAGIDAIFICTPPSLHTDGVQRALVANLDVLVEKPLATELESAAELVAKVEQQGRILAVGYNLRFHAGLREAKRLIDSGALGRTLIVRAEFGQYLPDWRPSQDYRDGYNAKASLGGGILLDQSHEIDYVRWIFGEVVAVSAVTARLSDLAIDVEDTALIHARLEGGAVAEIHLDSVRRDYRRSCTVIGTEATLEWDLRHGVCVRRPGGNVERSQIAPDVNDMYLMEARDLLDRIRTRQIPEANGRTALRVLEITLAARRSAIEKREVLV